MPAVVCDRDVHRAEVFDRTFPRVEAEDAFRYAARSGGRVLLSIDAEGR